MDNIHSNNLIHVRIPYLSVANKFSASNSTLVLKQHQSKKLQPQTLLLVDDDALLLESLTKLLTDDFCVISINKAQKALEKFQQDSFNCDIILYDLQMRELNGLDFYYQIKQDYPGLEKRIIFMSGGCYQSILMEFIEEKNILYLEKPFTKKKLYELIDQLANK